ncbi:hypothetical protein N9Y92_03065 [Chlamydiales bacterium]|nr:hypothetical protein [Chlamydiales bacterium]
MRRIVQKICLFLVVLTPLIGKDDYQVVHQPEVLKKAESLDLSGTLKQKENGFVYLDVSNEFITSIAPLLEHEGRLQVLPTAKKSTGAHISAFYESEGVSPTEIDQKFAFDVNEIRKFTLHTRDEVKKLWVIAVDAPELEDLRASYGLSPYLKGKAFHITIGKQLPVAPDGWQNCTDFSQFNFMKDLTLPMESSGDFTRLDSKEIKELIKISNGLGQLSLKSNGFVYLDVNNSVLDQFVPLLPIESEFSPTKGIGAHVSAIYESEMISHEIWNFDHAGEWFIFEMKEIRYVDRKTSEGYERLWLLAVDCPGLQRLRRHYGMKPKLQGHDFHITLGKEKINALLEAI